MRLLVDMNLSPCWTELLADAGMEAVHWSMLGRHDARDIEIMEYARAHDYVVLTHDLDFGAILAASLLGKPSVVQLRSEEIGAESIGDRVISALRQMSGELQLGALVTIDPRRTRLRVLPLRVGR